MRTVRSASYGVLYLLAATLVMEADSIPARDIASSRFFASDPRELQFSDAVGLDGREEKLAKILSRRDHTQRLAAAKALWQGHSRRYATEVLKYLAGSPPGGDAFRTFQREVEVAIQPEAILRELREGDYQWGAWLAFLRPHKDLVATLLAALKDRPCFLPETMLALGNSGDERALEPLLALLKTEDYRTPGDAATALGYLGRREAESSLIEALAAGNVWGQVNACGALAKIGTHEAIPALKRLAEDDRFTGTLNVKGMAKCAIETIVSRDSRRKSRPQQNS
jgi:hypothetical protein